MSKWISVEDRLSEDYLILRHLASCDFAATWQLAQLLGEQTARTRQRMKRLESSGKVQRDPRFKWSSTNNLVWKLPLPLPCNTGEGGIR